jgi:hypothetical protein
MVPIGVVELHETRAALNQSPGQQTIIGVGALARLGALHLQSLSRLLGEIDQLRTAGLHPVRHLIGGDARGNFRIARLGQLG